MTFTIGVTRDFLGPDGRLTYRDIGLGLLASQPHLRWRFLDDHRPEIHPDQIRDCDAVLSLTPRWSAASLADCPRLRAVARFGVGYDMCDLAAFRAAGVPLTITVGATDRPVAAGVLSMMLALTHRLLLKDRLVRTGRWHERAHHMGRELFGATLGIIGFGGAGKALRELVRPFDMRVLVYDPLVEDQVLMARGVERGSLTAVVAQADHLSLHCPLLESTRGLVNRDLLTRMKPTACLYNAARGPIMVEEDVIAALAAGTIAGAGLDVFVQEPPAAENPLLAMEQVVLAPHAICWTDECFQAIGEAAIRSLIDVAQGERPAGLVEPAVWESPRCRERQKAGSARAGAGAAS